MATIWSEALRRDSVDLHDDFFDLGGESLPALRIMARIRTTFAVELDVRSLIDAPTVAEMARLVGERLAARTAPGEASAPERAAGGEWAHLVELQAGRGRRPVFVIPGGVGGEGEFFVYARLARHVGPEHPFYGLKARSAEGKEASPDSVEEMASEYLREIRARQPDGPLIVVGECAGGVIAYEIAQRLYAEGQEPALLLLMDTPRPDDFSEPRAHFLHITRWTHHREELRRLSAKDKLGYLVRAGGRMVQTMGRARADAVGDIQRTYVQAIYGYRPKPYRGKLTLLVNEEVSRISPSLGWADLAAGGIEIRRVPGNHVSYIRGSVRAVARTLRECLEQADRPGPAGRAAPSPGYTGSSPRATDGASGAR
ncbi:MAG TPA: thioesterase domain-containing protein [Methylomirabilota bacterium]|jgi:thioesterase domain-containing protein/acyl carrier protein